MGGLRLTAGFLLKKHSAHHDPYYPKNDARDFVNHLLATPLLNKTEIIFNLQLREIIKLN